MPYIGEIRIFGGNFAPVGWEFCNGQLLPISENEVLFQIIGTTYGGDGQATFALPDLRGRVPMHMNQGAGLSPRTPGEQGGTESVTLTVNQLPNHTHTPRASSMPGNQPSPQGGAWSKSNAGQFANLAPNTSPAANLIAPAGGSQPHENMMPFLGLSFIISLFGVFPSEDSGSPQEEPFLSEMRMVAFNFAPKGWTQCNGQFLTINQNQALFSLLGTTYGGNGQTTFQLPDLRSRVPISTTHSGNAHTLGERSGEEAHTLSQPEMPTHTHIASGNSGNSNSSTPKLNAWGKSTLQPYRADQLDLLMHPGSVSNAGGSQPHPNLPPYAVINTVIALQGIFPSRN